jgi:hypothetical protein
VLGGEAAGSDSSASFQSKVPRCLGVCESERTRRGLARATGAWGCGSLLEELAAADLGSIKRKGEERERYDLCKVGCHHNLQPSETNRLL